MDWLADQVDYLAKQASVSLIFSVDLYRWSAAQEDELQEITMYDVKSAVNKAKNMVLNLSEIEAKVKEATNDDTWGASSTLMQEIAQSTFDFQLFNEIMPTIYARFTDKEARQWRQIYKALVLLEYLVKNGSERVVDDARSHLSLIKVLRNFHYIDENGKDQGINVRNRSKELAELLQDLDKVRMERRKAKQNRNKYQGIGNDGFGGGGGGGMSFTTSTGSRYGGFGSETVQNEGGFSGGYSGSASSGFRDSRPSAQEFEEYDAGDWEESDRPRRAGSSSRDVSSRSNGRAAASGSGRTSATTETKPEPPKQEVNLFDFDDDDGVAQPSPTPPPKFTSTMPAVSVDAGDDDFDDFQSAGAPAGHATAAITPAPAPTAAATRPHQNVFDLLNSQPAKSSSTTSSFASTPATSPSVAAPPMYGNFAPLQAQPAAGAASAASRPNYASQNSTASSSVKPSASASASKPASDFSDLFGDFNSVAKTKPIPSSGSYSSMTGGSGSGKMTLAQIQQQKAQDKLFASTTNGGAGGGSSSSSSSANNGGGVSGWDSLL
ncbi:Epsin-3, clathrin recruitment and traffic between the Golgi and endosome [Microbotryomycetes sp. JL201]|nr:Epsin-3, clathrin recruitment and traffic between the Golgi and endosome [Microbotryomycetes sp. JL201]